MPEPGDKLSEREVRAAGAAILRLPKMERLAVMLRYDEGGMSEADVGRVLEISEDEARRLLERARWRIRTELRRRP